MLTQPPQIIGRLVRAVVRGGDAHEFRHLLTQPAVAKVGGDKEQAQGRHQGHDPEVAEGQKRHGLTRDHPRLGVRIEHPLGQGAVLADGFNLQQATIGLEADGPQGGQVDEFASNAKVAGVVDGGLGAQGVVELEVLLDLRVLIADMQRGDDPLGEDPGAEDARGTLGDAPVEDQADLLGTTQIEVLPDQFLEQMTPGHGSVEDLGAGEFGLKDRQFIAEAGGTIRGGEGLGQAGKPFAHHRVDLLRRQAVQYPLQGRRVRAPEQTVVQCLKGDPRLGQLALGELIPVEIDAGGVGKVGREFDAQGAEVLTHHIEVVLIAHHVRSALPGEAVARQGIVLRADVEGAELLLGHADVENALAQQGRGF